MTSAMKTAERPAPMLTRTGLATLPRVNLLPPEIGERSRFRRVQAGMGVAVIVAAGVIGLLTVMAGNDVTDAQGEVDAAQAQQTQLQRKVMELSNVRDVYTRVAGAEQLLTQAMGSEVQWSHYLNDLSLTIPSNVWITNLSYSAQAGAPAATPGAPAAPANPITVPNAVGTVTVSGVAFEYDDVATWLETLAKQKGYANPYFSSAAEMKIGERRLVKFDSTATVTTDALSGRYTKPAGVQR